LPTSLTSSSSSLHGLGESPVPASSIVGEINGKHIFKEWNIPAFHYRHTSININHPENETGLTMFFILLIQFPVALSSCLTDIHHSIHELHS
jgi:hypothetical protein